MTVFGPRSTRRVGSGRGTQGGPSKRAVARASLAAGASTAFAVAAFACESSTTQTAYTPYQGVDVPSALVTTGVGCGDAGLAYYAALIAPHPDGGGPFPQQRDSGACATPPDPSSVLAGSFVRCYVPSASFDTDASEALDVWIYGYAGATPANVSCTDTTCPLLPGPRVSGGIATLLGDQADPSTRATRTLHCFVTSEASQHPEAYGCVDCSDLGDAGAGAADAGSGEGSSGDAGDAGSGDAGEARSGDGSSSDGSSSVGDGSSSVSDGSSSVGDGSSSVGDGSSSVGDGSSSDASSGDAGDADAAAPPSPDQ